MPTPLWSAVRFGTLSGTSFGAEEIRQIAGPAEHSAAAVAAYLARLAGEGVLVRLESGDYAAGPRAAEWRAHQPKTQPGGNSARYRAQQAARDQIRARAWREGRNGVLTGHEGAGGDDAVAGGDIMADMSQLAADMGTLMSAHAFAQAMGVHLRTVRRWIRQRKVTVVRLGGVVRVKVDADVIERVR